MYEGTVLKLRSKKGREVYITVLEVNKYWTPRGERTFIKYHQEDKDFGTESVQEDSLQYVREHFFEIDPSELRGV